MASPTYSAKSSLRAHRVAPFLLPQTFRRSDAPQAVFSLMPDLVVASGQQGGLSKWPLKPTNLAAKPRASKSGAKFNVCMGSR